MYCLKFGAAITGTYCLNFGAVVPAALISTVVILAVEYNKQLRSINGCFSNKRLRV